MANSTEVAKNTKWSMGYIRDSEVSQNYLGEVRGKTAEYPIIFITITEMLSLLPF